VGTRHALDDAEHFLQLLEVAEAQGAGLDLQWLGQQLKQRAMQSGDAQSNVSLLTLHKSKGLEFDHVIIPALSRIGRGDARDILLWDEHSDSAGNSAFLLAADDHSTTDAPTLYNYLLASRKRKTQLESARLMYVGATRAIRKLVLTCQLHRDPKTDQWRQPARGSLLHPIWPAIEQQVIVHQDSGSNDHREAIEVEAPLLTRLKTAALARPHSAGINKQSPAPANLPLFADSRMQRTIGTVVHRALEELSLKPVLPNAASARDVLRWRMALQREGLWGAAVEEALDQVQIAVTATLNIECSGRWVLSSKHQQAYSEWPLTTVDSDGRIRDIVIDRCFIDAATGVRWIIDYKTSRPRTTDDFAAFIARESDNHRDQLLRYRDAVRPLCDESIRCALYFPFLGYLHTLTELELPELLSAGKKPGAQDGR
jgi:ATP-dependent exoDNAse (exonuclease V) beta subunit